jgi:hypothetical protein
MLILASGATALGSVKPQLPLAGFHVRGAECSQVGWTSGSIHCREWDSDFLCTAYWLEDSYLRINQEFVRIGPLFTHLVPLDLA